MKGETPETGTDDLRAERLDVPRAQKPVQGPITRAVVENLRALRRARHWSGLEVAERMATLNNPWNHQTVSQLERGSRVAITVDELVALAALFEVTPEKLLGEAAITTTDERLHRLEAAVFGGQA